MAQHVGPCGRYILSLQKTLHSEHTLLAVLNSQAIWCVYRSLCLQTQESGVRGVGRGLPAAKHQWRFNSLSSCLERPHPTRPPSKNPHLAHCHPHMCTRMCPACTHTHTHAHTRAHTHAHQTHEKQLPPQPTAVRMALYVQNALNKGAEGVYAIRGQKGCTRPFSLCWRQNPSAQGTGKLPRS